MTAGDPAPDALEIRSYRAVFDLERRVYRIDRLRLNPGGVPVRGLLYFVALLLGGAVFSRLPAAGGLLRLLPWYLRDLALPAGIATVLTLMRVDGRPFHLAVRALVRHGVAPTRLCRLGCGVAPRGRWYPPALLVLPDGSDPRVRRLSYRGPGAIRIGLAHERVEWRPGPVGRLLRRPDVTVRPLEPLRPLQKAQIIELGSGSKLAVGKPLVTHHRPRPRPRRRNRAVTSPR